MLPATTPGMAARWEATSRSRASREMRLATISTMWQKRPASSDSRNGLRGTLSSDLFANDPGSGHHCTQFCECHLLRQMQAAAIGQNEHALGGYELQRFADAFGNDFRCLDLVRLHVDHANTKFKLVGKLFKQFEVFSAAPREFECELLHVSLEDCREEISIVPGPRRFAITIAVAHVQGNFGIDACNERV